MPKVYLKRLSTIEVVPNSFDLDNNLALMKSKMVEADTSFYQINLGSVVQQFVRWKSLLPRVKPFFAVKCHPDPILISLLGEMGAGFDCASKNELKIVSETIKFSNANASENIIYANPYKFKKGIIYASRIGVTLTTFDTENELIKIANEWPNAKLLLRLSTLRVYDSADELASKFGTDPDEVSTLLYRAKELSMDIVGLCFHVGSGCKEMDAFPETALYCSKVMELARDIGFNPYLLDIGGGFPGLSSINDDFDKQREFETMCSKLNLVLDTYFPEEHNYKIIAEPGRYFVLSAYTLVTQIIGKRSQDLDEDVSTSSQDSGTDFCDKDNSTSSSCCSINDNHLFNNSWNQDDSNKAVIKKTVSNKLYRYIMNDGVYNSFHNILFGDKTIFPSRLFGGDGYFHDIDYQGQYYKTTLFGPTCDGHDCVLTGVKLPHMDIGDWLVWPNMGAYTTSTCTGFNGIPLPKKYYFIGENDIERMDKIRTCILSDSEDKEVSETKITLLNDE